MKNTRLYALLVALSLNLLPLTRVATTLFHVKIRPSYAVVSQWTGISAALLGSYDAVSGASTIITSPNQANGKVGEAFSYRITSAPDQGNVFRASPLPAGLQLGSGRRRSFIEGTPTEPGVFDVRVVVSDDNRPSRTISKTIKLTIESDIQPVRLLSTPLEQTLDVGEDLFLSVLAAGTNPIQYQWFRDKQPLEGETSPVLRLRGVEANQGGLYHVTATNIAGEISSTPVAITINEPLPALPPRILGIQRTDAGIQVQVDGHPTRSTHIEYSESLYTPNWQPLETIPPTPEATATITDTAITAAVRFYRALRD